MASGVRYDLAFADEEHGDEYIRELVANHVGGHLKIAPEHISPGVVKVMKKPGKEMFVRFKELFERYSDGGGQGAVPGALLHLRPPGLRMKDMVELSDYLAENGWRPQQVQDFTPTPMTLATDMYYSGYHPKTGKPVHVPQGRATRRRCSARCCSRTCRSTASSRARRASGRERRSSRGKSRDAGADQRQSPATASRASPNACQSRGARLSTSIQAVNGDGEVGERNWSAGPPREDPG